MSKLSRTTHTCKPYDVSHQSYAFVEFEFEDARDVTRKNKADHDSGSRNPTRGCRIFTSSEPQDEEMATGVGFERTGNSTFKDKFGFP